MTPALWVLTVLGSIVLLFSVTVAVASCCLAGLVDEQSDAARPGGNTSVAATHLDPVLGNAGRAQTPLRVVR